jgi:hypothetical protein
LTERLFQGKIRRNSIGAKCRMTNPQDTTDLVQRGKAAARVGRLDLAREYLSQAVQQAPDHIEAWLALAAVEDNPSEKEACLKTVLQLDPDNVDAKLGLEMLRGEPAQPAPEVEPVLGAPSGLDTQSAPEVPSALEAQAEEDELESVIAAASARLEEAVGPPPAGEVPPDDEIVYCANHPSVETMLRCNRCSKPICTRCAVRTPVGYRCKQCVGQQQQTFYTGGTVDYVIGGIIAVVLGGIASYIVGLLGAWFLALILGPTLGIGIAELVRLAVRRRRSQYLWLVVGGGIGLGALPALFMALATMNLWTLVSLGLFLVLSIGAAAARLR